MAGVFDALLFYPIGTEADVDKDKLLIFYIIMSWPGLSSKQGKDTRDKMFRIVTVDDDKTFTEKVEKAVQNFFDEIKERFSVKRYCEGKALLDELAANRRYDIYLLDVEMPGIDGLELAQRIRSIDRDADIIFISAHEKYAVPSYKIQARYYILKAEYESEIPVILRQIWKECMDTETDHYVIQNTSYGKRLRLDDVVYLKREKKYVLFSCLDGNKYRERGSLGGVYCKLPHDRFVYIDRGYVINLKHAIGWDGDVIRLDNGVELTASRRMSQGVKDAIAQYWGQTIGGQKATVCGQRIVKR